MSKVLATSRIPAEYNRQTFYEILSAIQTQLNALSEGQLVAAYNAYTAAPTTGTYAIGDYIRNSAPAEAGSASSMYVILGWVCTASGTPGTWVEVRALTGN